MKNLSAPAPPAPMSKEERMEAMVNALKDNSGPGKFEQITIRVFTEIAKIAKARGGQ